MSATRDEALVELIEQAMMSGFMQIVSNKDRIAAAYTGETDQPGADLLRAALDDYPAKFIQIRSDLVEAVLA